MLCMYVLYRSPPASLGLAIISSRPRGPSRPAAARCHTPRRQCHSFYTQRLTTAAGGRRRRAPCGAGQGRGAPRARGRPISQHHGETSTHGPKSSRFIKLRGRLFWCNYQL